MKKDTPRASNDQFRVASDSVRSIAVCVRIHDICFARSCRPRALDRQNGNFIGSFQLVSPPLSLVVLLVFQRCCFDVRFARACAGLRIDHPLYILKSEVVHVLDRHTR